MHSLINTYYSLSSRIFMLMADEDINISDTGISELDEPINRLATLIASLCTGIGFIWLVVSIVMFGFAWSEQSPHEKKTALKSAFGGAIVMFAGAIALFIAGRR